MENNSEPTFGGTPTIPPPEVFERAQQNNPGWYQVLYKAYEQFAQRPENAGIYAVPGQRGATIQQIWLLHTALWGIEPYCLVAKPLPETATQRVTRLVNCSAAQLVEWLEVIQDADNKVIAPLAYHDGKMGHCITIKSYDPERDRFIYHDPWPERSLLAIENNAAEVNALPENDAETLWSITAQELERVVFATFLMPWQYARIQELQFELFDSEWRESEFFKFFHVKQLEETFEDDRVIRKFSAGPFKNDIALWVVAHKDSGRIHRASLRVRNEWFINNHSLALDIAKSFITSFAPPPDRATYAEIANALSKLRDPRFLLQAKDSDPNESNALSCIHALMGSLKSADVTTDFAKLSIEGVEDDSGAWRSIEFLLL